jgi:hypothetical protein
MATKQNFTLWRSVFVIVLTATAVAIMGRTPPVEAQGRPDLETLHQRLLPLFETAGVVFTDGDETRGRLVVGVLDRAAERSIRGRLRALGVDSQSVDVVETEPIMALATLRDRATTIAGGLQIRFSQYLCSLGFPAFNENGLAGFVTASHCSDRQGSVDSTTYYQPSAQIPNDLSGQRSRIRPTCAAEAARKVDAADSRTPTSAAQMGRGRWGLASSARSPEPRDSAP